MAAAALPLILSFAPLLPGAIASAASALTSLVTLAKSLKNDANVPPDIKEQLDLALASLDATAAKVAGVQV